MYYYIIMKIIRVMIDETLLELVDTLAKENGQNRSSFIREALEYHIKKLRTLQLEDKHRLAHQKQSIHTKEYEIWHNEQCWGDM